MKKMNLLMMAAAMSLMIVSSGCVPVVAGGALMGSGAVSYLQGNLIVDIKATPLELHKASVAALADLNIFIFNEIATEKKLALNGEYKDKTKVQITAETTSQFTSKLKILVNGFGDKEKSQDILKRIQAKL